MSLSCTCGDYDGADWWWTSTFDFTILKTKRSRKCCSCAAKIKPGDDTVEFSRTRGPNNDIEERIYGDEVSIAPWFMCETCAGLAMAVNETGMCFSIGESMKDQIAEYRAEELAYRSKP